MARLWRLVGVGALATTVMAIGASAASATTFYVNGASGNDANPCTSLAAPCKTIGAAVTKSEAVPDTATINVAAGIYPEVVDLSHPADSGITIVGAGSGPGGTKVEGPAGAKKATFYLFVPGNSATLSNLSIVNPGADKEAGIASAANLTLNNVMVDIQAVGNGDGIATGELGGQLTVNGGGVTMESGTEGTGILAAVAPLALNGVTVTMANGSGGYGIESEFSPASLTNVAVNMANETRSGIMAVTTGAFSANGVSVTMSNAANEQPAVVQEFGGATLRRLEVGGTWKGAAFEGVFGSPTLSDSRLTSSATSTKPTLIYIGTTEGSGLLVQRSVVQDAATTKPGALLVEGGNATLDSSEVLGGESGVFFFQRVGKVRTLTVASSTIDAGVLGAADKAPVTGVNVKSTEPGSIANVSIEGSILLEPQSATVEAGATAANVTCTYSDVPSQAQAASGTGGSIACANGFSGNMTSAPASLFLALGTNYSLNPSSTAIDSVPAGAISLPFGLTPSATDLAGNPRVVNGRGGCAAVQDKGALELQGHGGACPSPPAVVTSAKPTPGVITGLALSPSSFFAAPSGATVAKAKRKYGTTVSYRDSQAGTTTFTVLRPVAGRKQGKTCRKPGKANRHGKRCTLYVALGGFTHTDTAGANHLRFSGRLKGRKLAKGSYRLQAVPHNAAGNGAAVAREFAIKG